MARCMDAQYMGNFWSENSWIGKKGVIIGTVRYSDSYSSTEQTSNCGRASVVGAVGIFHIATQKKTCRSHWEVRRDVATWGDRCKNIVANNLSFDSVRKNKEDSYPLPEI